MLFSPPQMKRGISKAFDSMRQGIKRTFSGKENKDAQDENEQPESQEAKELTGDDQAMDTAEDGAPAEGEKKDGDKPKTRKIKKQVRKGELPIASGTASLEESLKAEQLERENQMTMEDKLVADTEDKKNELESFIYELRGKIEEQYAEFASEEEKEKLRAKLTDSEVS